VAGLTDAIFFLYSLSSETADKLIEMMGIAKAKSLRDYQPHTVVMPLDHGKGGITYVVEFDRKRSLHKHIMVYSAARKYITKADEWLGLGSYTTSQNMIDSVVYSNDPWKSDPEMQKLADTVIVQPGQIISRKVGRNDPCYCGSGKKYKKCHYLKESSR
jgi:preprotein translocase subunit SecA